MAVAGSPGVVAESREVFYFLSVRATKFIQGNTDSISQHTVLGSNVVLKA